MMADDREPRDMWTIEETSVAGNGEGYSATYFDMEGYGTVGLWRPTWAEILAAVGRYDAHGRYQ